ncbi:MAG: D-alanyl-D-alanine carboxypeptidase [Ruminococcus sp.]|nr:D-alanyl-D-alanine carboxypeptidase [Ruminococcus sp.]
MNKEREPGTAHKFRLSGTAVSIFVLIISGIAAVFYGCSKVPAALGAEQSAAELSAEGSSGIPGDTADQSDKGNTAVPFVIYPHRSESTTEFSDDLDAEAAVLFNASTGEIVAAKNEEAPIFPASLTKVMTLIVTVENAESLSDTVEITQDMIDPMVEADASRCGFEPGDTPTVEDLLYGMILASGADATLAAADYTAGSETAMAAMMNKKAKEIGLHDTYFTNVTGLHSDQHHSTVSDMGTILAYAIQNDLCRKILSTEYYELDANEMCPDGIELHSTLKSRMYGDEMPGILVLGGKTGYTDKAKCCVESFAEADGETYILVIAGATTNWNAVYDTLSSYSIYCIGGESYEPSRYKKREK